MRKKKTRRFLRSMMLCCTVNGKSASKNFCVKYKALKTSNNCRLESAFDVTRPISIPGSLSLWCDPPLQKNLRGMPDVRPKIHGPIHDKSHKISTQIRIRKRSSYIERNKTKKNLNSVNAYLDQLVGKWRTCTGKFQKKPFVCTPPPPPPTHFLPQKYKSPRFQTQKSFQKYADRNMMLWTVSRAAITFLATSYVELLTHNSLVAFWVCAPFCGERAVFTWQNIDLYFLPSFVDNNNKIEIISNLCSAYMQTP